MATMAFTMVLLHFYREIWIRASNLYTASSRSYQLPFLSGVRHGSIWSEHGERSHPNFSHAAGVLVGKYIMDCKTVVAQAREIETLSRAIHFEHVPLRRQTGTLFEEENEETPEEWVSGRMGVVKCACNWFMLVQKVLFGVSGWFWRSAHCKMYSNLYKKCIEILTCH